MAQAKTDGRVAFTLDYGALNSSRPMAGHAWINNTVGHPDTREKLDLIEEKLKSKVEGLAGSEANADANAKLWISLFEILQTFPGGDVSMVQPDGTVLPPFNGGKSIIGPWGIAIDGNDNVWVANATGRSVFFGSASRSTLR